MIFEDGAVVVQQGFVRSRHNVKIIRRPRMFVVVYDGSDQSGKNF